MSRIISGKMRLDVQRVDLADTIAAAVEVVHLAAEAKGVRIEIVADPLAGPISGDPNRVQQMIWNLLTNAVKFTPHGGKVQITVERVSSHIELSVSDNGEGIDRSFFRTFLTGSARGMNPVTQAKKGLGWGWPSSSTWRRCTAARCGPRAAASERDRRSSWCCPFPSSAR